MHTYTVTVTLKDMTHVQTVRTVNPMLALAIVANFFGAGTLKDALSVTCVVSD